MSEGVGRVSFSSYLGFGDGVRDGRGLGDGHQRILIA